MVRKDKVPPACQLWHQCKKFHVKLSTAKRNPNLHACGEWQCSSCSEYHTKKLTHPLRKKKRTDILSFMTWRRNRTTFSDAIRAIPLLVSDVVVSVLRRNDSVRVVDCVKIVRIHPLDCNNTKLILPPKKKRIIKKI